MRILVFGLVVFLFTHGLAIFPRTRAFFIEHLGEAYHKRFMAVGALIGLIAIVYGYSVYRDSGYIPVWNPPVWTRHLAATLMLFSIILMVSAFIPSMIKAKAKHPMLASVKIWAFSHLLSNGDLGSIILFGSFLVWAVVARISMKYRAPMLSLASLPHMPVRFGRNDVIVIVLGSALYLAIVFRLHLWLIGVPVFMR
jgi:uncharacterized membrane protein